MNSANIADKRVLVTGATGFVGKAVVRELLIAGYSVTCVGGPKTRFDDQVFDGADASKNIDIADYESVSSLHGIGCVDAVVHAAGIAHRFGKVESEQYNRVNVTGTENICRLADRLRAGQVVLISTVLVYGTNRIKDDVAPITEEIECRPADEYAKSKLEAEHTAKRICGEKGIPVAILRPAPIVGEGSKGNVARLIRAIDRRRFMMVGGGRNRKNLVYVGDVAKAVRMILENRSNSSEVLNIAASPVDVRRIVEEIGTMAGRRILPFPFSPDLLRNSVQILGMLGFKQTANGFLRSLDMWLGENVYSTEKIERVYGFKPAMSSVDALRMEVEWYLANK